MRSGLLLVALIPVVIVSGARPFRGPAKPGPVVADTNARSRDSLMNDVLERIKGKETQPAESVFKNIKLFKGLPAAQIPRIMNLGYGRALGVSCGHCHVVGEWDKEDKPQKQIAREMAAMANAIIFQYLANIKNLKSERPLVNCTTCHRGEVKPALNLPPDQGR